MEKRYKLMLDVIKCSIWEREEATADREVYEEMRLHGIIGLPGNILNKLAMPPELFQEWERSVVKRVFHYYRYKQAESQLPLSVPYVILKGSSAAQYYPFPELRMLGDIDIMTCHEDYLKACEMMISGGFKEVTGESERNRGRHRCFAKGDIVVEVHSFFASVTDPEQAKYLDELIIQNITHSHILPDHVNGLVLLEHISQHLRNGIGLRQIIDWMMFVNQCLSDENWPSFSEMAKKLGLEKLAIVTTRMCEMYLGLPDREWSSVANKYLCEQLIMYILSCGSFGNKWIYDYSASVTVFANIQTINEGFRFLQDAGLKNWKACKQYPFLRHFAWLYQAGRFVFKGLNRTHVQKKLKEEYKEAVRRRVMFEELGVKFTSGELVTYKDGEYVVEKN